MVHPLRMARLQRQSPETVSMPNVRIGVFAIQPMVSVRVLHGMVRRPIYGRLQTVPVVCFENSKKFQKVYGNLVKLCTTRVY